MHLYVNNFKCEIEERIHSGINLAPHPKGKKIEAAEKQSVYGTLLERLEYMCAFILPLLASSKLFISSRSIQSECVLWRRSYI